jgi:hypothetical protein
MFRSSPCNYSSILPSSEVESPCVAVARPVTVELIDGVGDARRGSSGRTRFGGL